MDAPSGYRLQADDTSRAAERLLFRRWQAMDPDAKARLVVEACAALHELCIAGLRHRMPEASERELSLRAAALKYGRDVVRRATGVDVPDEGVRIP